MRMGGFDHMASNRTSPRVATSAGAPANGPPSSLTTTARTLAASLAAAFWAHNPTARSFTSTAHTLAAGARRARATAMGPYPHPRSRRSPEASEGWGASCSRSLVPGSIRSEENTPRSLVNTSSWSGSESRTDRSSEPTAGWRAKYWDEGPDTLRR